MAKKMTPLERARQNERLANEALAAGNIAAAQAYQANLVQQMGSGGGAGVANVQSRVDTAITAATDFRTQVEDSQKVTPTDDTDTDGGGNTVATQTPGDRAQQLYYEGLKSDSQRSARAFLNTLLSQYNMTSLAGQIESLIQESTNEEYLAERIRQTSEYKTRFKGLVDLQARGITDVRNEAEYLDLETSYRRVFREAGLGNYLGTAGTQNEYTAIADLVGKYSLSVNEVQDRVLDAQRVVAETPQEVRDSLQRYYNIDPGTLVEYALDPSRTQAKINQLANTAIVGGYAARAGLDLDLRGAESVAGLSGTQDVSTERLTTDMAASRAIRDATKRLADIEKSDLSDTEVVGSTLGINAEAAKKVKTLQSRERARFSGTSGIGQSTLTSARTI